MKQGIEIPKIITDEKTVTILGSTGSIGQSTIDLLRHHQDRFTVDTLTGYKNVDLLAEQARSLGADRAVIGDETLYLSLKSALSGTNIEVAAGEEAVNSASEGASDLIMSAIVGFAGLKPTLSAITQGKTIALANKECLVCAGNLMMEEVVKHDATLLPVDSEHNAIFQVLEDKEPASIKRLILTASGGPFRNKSRDELHNITPEQAVAHPNWSMGAKISVDSATMMNKALEVIEAHYLFNMPSSKIDVLIHPQSIVHSMVEYIDGSILAQMGAPDMRTPIAFTLAWPDRIQTSGAQLDITKNFNLDFEVPDIKRFKSLKTVRDVLKKTGASIVFNGANEIAVAAFLEQRIKFTDIEVVVEETLQKTDFKTPICLEDVFTLNQYTRTVAERVVACLQ